MDHSAWWKEYSSGYENTAERYKKKGAPDYIVGICGLGGGKPQGNAMENHARYCFPSTLKPRRKGVGQDWHDHTVPTNGLYAEQKSSTNRGDNSKKFNWQHIEPSHPWSFLLLTGIDYDAIYYWALSRDAFTALLHNNKITNQGSQNGDSSEGYWMWYEDVKEALTPIKNDSELNDFIQSLNPESIPKAPPVPEKKPRRARVAAATPH